MKFQFLSMVALAVCLSGVSAQADDTAARQLFETAKTSFAARVTNDLSPIEATITTLNQAQAQAVDKELKYDILILASRAQYFKGEHTSGDKNKEAIFLVGQANADAAEALSKDYAEAPYFAGINLARWGEAHGIVSSLAKVPQLKRYMAAAQARVTRDDQDGESVDGFGPHRTLGRMLKKLPGVLGGSHSESVKELDKAVKGAPTLALNTVYLADSLMKDGNGAEQAEGRRLLTEMLAKDVRSFNPARPTETQEEFESAKLVLEGKEIN